MAHYCHRPEVPKIELMSVVEQAVCKVCGEEIHDTVDQRKHIACEIAAGIERAARNKAKTDDEGKLPLSWLPWAALEAVSRVQVHGHKKYQNFNNYRKGMEVTRNTSCALRHITKYLAGETTDPESGEHHLAHAICRLAFILQNEAEGTAIDDRFTPQSIGACTCPIPRGGPHKCSGGTDGK